MSFRVFFKNMNNTSFFFLRQKRCIICLNNLKTVRAPWHYELAALQCMTKIYGLCYLVLTNLILTIRSSSLTVSGKEGMIESSY